MRLWSTESGKLLHTYEGHRSYVNAIAFSPDGEKILSGSRDNTVRLWDTDSGKLVHTLEGHTSSVNAIAFSPDGQKILSGSRDNTVRLWDTDSGKLVHTYEGHRSEVYAIAFSPDGQQILSGSTDNTVRLWLGLDGQNLLKEGCNQLQLHPLLVEPENNLAGEACLDYAGWEDKAKAEFLVRQGLAMAQSLIEEGTALAREGKIEEAIAVFKEAQKFAPDIDLNPYTEAIDKDPKTVAQQLAAPTKVKE